MKILNVVGARPNFMKIAPLTHEMRKYRDLTPVLVHTGQHYDETMSKVFFEDLEIDRPDVNLGVGSGSHADQTGRIMMAFERLCEEEHPDLVVVVGDVNSTLACSVVAAKLQVPVAHVEAGLRSRDRSMPEEINRLVTDCLSDYLFTPSRDADANLVAEGVPAEKIHFVGNVMVDTLLKHRDKARGSDVLRRLGLGQGEAGRYALLTLHRPSNVDDAGKLSSLLDALETLGRQLPVVFPAHPRTRRRLEEHGLGGRIRDMRGLLLQAPLGYLDFLALMDGAALVLTDSGGMQEETTVLGVPCLTLRENTERPVTILEGTNTLVGTDTRKILEAAEELLANGGKKGKVPELWDGRAAERIVRVLRGRAS